MTLPDSYTVATDVHATTGAQLPGVTVVIPVHNKSTITRQCLEAILAEEYPGASREIIVVDDGSKDATPAMLDGYGRRIRVLRGAEAQGFAAACNAGVEAAQHDLVVLLNNDTIPTAGWLTTLVQFAVDHPAAAVVGSKLIFPNDTIQHAGVVFGIDKEPHHIYAGFPKDHPATTKSRQFQVVTAACALFRRQVWNELGGLDTSYKNGWEDVDYCMRVGEAGHQILYCADCIVYHFESATRDLLSTVERENRALFGKRWRDKIVPDDIGYYAEDELFSIVYGARNPIQITVSPLLAGITTGEEDRLADKILYDRARQVMILLRNNIVLNVRVDEAEARTRQAEHRLRQALHELAQFKAATAEQPRPAPPDDQPAVPTPEVPSTTPEVPQQTPRKPSRIVGIVESPGRLPDVVTDGMLIVTGWTLTESGEARVEAIINGEPRGTIEYGELRLDAAALFPDFPAGANCGFTGEIPVADLGDGFHDCTVRIWANDADHAELTTKFEVDNHAFETGRVIGRIDLPVRGALFIPREVAIVSGWVMAPSGIRSIEPLIDGEPRGRIDYGALRPDIGKRRRQYDNADHCGFSGSIPMHGLPPGNHDLLVRVTAHDGKILELPQRIEVEGTDTIDGGVPVLNRHYRQWLDKQALFVTIGAPNSEPDISGQDFALFVPLEDAQESDLIAIVDSLIAQTYGAWRLSLIAGNDGSADLRAVVNRLALLDSRICAIESSGRSALVSIKAEMANSDATWIAILPCNVRLAPDALTNFAKYAERNPEAVMLYGDDDRVDPESDERWNPFFKPDWSPDLALSMDYLGPARFFRREAALQAGGLDPHFSEAALYDLALRLSETPGTVVHVPGIQSTISGKAPARDIPWHLGDWCKDARRAVSAALQRRGESAAVERGLHPGTWRVRYELGEPPGVTAVIPTGGNLRLLEPCLDDLFHRTDYPQLEILLVDNSGGDAVANLVAELSRTHGNVRRIVDGRKPFNYSALINAAIPHVTTPQILMLNDDITVIDPTWLTAMVEQAQRPGVGIVGCKLIYPDDTIQHAGVILGPFGGSVHVFKRLPRLEPGYFDLPDVVRNVSAVTFACALIDRAVFEEIGGLDAEHLPVAFNDTDFCLRAREAGYEVIYTPFAELYHHESVTKTVIAHPSEIGYLRDRWGHIIAHDPYYNPNLTRQGEDARLNMETPRVS